MKSLYLLINLFTVIVPVIFSFHPKLQFYKHWKAFFLSSIIVALAFILWDIQFTKLGVWGFNPNYVTGIFLDNLPIEEVLFFICIPFSCVFTYHCLNIFYQYKWKPQTETFFIIILSILLFAIGIINYDKLYTFYTFVSIAILLILLKFAIKITWLPKLLSIYPILLIPFFIVNGILTGTGIEQPVVWYNNVENLGIRLLTIPIEDIFYGFELILLNVFLYQFMIQKANSKNQ